MGTTDKDTDKELTSKMLESPTSLQTLEGYNNQVNLDALENAVWSIRGLVEHCNNIETNLKYDIYETIDIALKQINEIYKNWRIK